MIQIALGEILLVCIERNETLPEEKQDSELAAFTDSEGADGIQDLTYGEEIYRRVVLQGIPNLSLKDPAGDFTPEQRFVIYLKY